MNIEYLFKHVQLHNQNHYHFISACSNHSRITIMKLLNTDLLIKDIQHHFFFKDIGLSIFNHGVQRPTNLGYKVASRM